MNLKRNICSIFLMHFPGRFVVLGRVASMRIWLLPTYRPSGPVRDTTYPVSTNMPSRWAGLRQCVPGFYQHAVPPGRFASMRIWFLPTYRPSGPVCGNAYLVATNMLSRWATGCSSRRDDILVANHFPRSHPSQRDGML